MCGESYQPETQNSRNSNDLLFHCSDLQGVIVGMGLYMLEQLYIEETKYVPSPPVEKNVKKRKAQSNIPSAVEFEVCNKFCAAIVVEVSLEIPGRRKPSADRCGGHTACSGRGRLKDAERTLDRSAWSVRSRVSAEIEYCIQRLSRGLRCPKHLRQVAVAGPCASFSVRFDHHSRSTSTTTTSTPFAMDMQRPQDPAVLSSSPLTSPADESDNQLSPSVDLQEQPQSLPGLDGAPVRCKFAL